MNKLLNKIFRWTKKKWVNFIVNLIISFSIGVAIVSFLQTGAIVWWGKTINRVIQSVLFNTINSVQV